MPQSVCLPSAILLACLAAAAQKPDTVRVVCEGALCTLSVNTFRALDAVATELHSRFGIPVSAENPIVQFRGDMIDASVENPKLRPGTLVPARWGFNVSFAIRPDGSLFDHRELLRSMVAAANEHSGFGWRLDDNDGLFSFVATRTHDTQGRSVEATPLLDRLVTIAPGTRRINESAALMSAELSKQTGLQVSCCESFVAGVRWGMEQMPFAAENEPARVVLRRLGMTVWHVRCDASVCFIDRR